MRLDNQDGDPEEFEPSHTLAEYSKIRSALGISRDRWE